ncbi:kinase-like domain-containing protein [Rhizophagus clarus]|uniref:Kinase-like domain-containing protein n=1 Tax=Rhizophagus clarus TaxID=94130 RepID=A0A8H3LVF4_9GLOM|nr:kinase-like domain-containing protein [Rhizophagus clarus]
MSVNAEEIDEYPEGNSCPVCKKIYNNTLFWCTVCDSKRLQDDFSNWTKDQFGIVYSATWVEGPRWKWDNELMQWVASGPRKIAFKMLKRDSVDERRKEFLKELENHSTCIGVKRIVHCFGVTRHPGDLTSYIRKNHQKLTWVMNGCCIPKFNDSNIGHVVY